MKNSRMLIFAIIIASLMFSACTMSASTPPPVTPTTNLSEIARQATETAIAKTPKTGDTQIPEETSEISLEGTVEATTSVDAVATATSTPGAAATSAPIVVTEYAVPDSYTLHQGEFVFCLARRFNILPEDILTYNNIAPIAAIEGFCEFNIGHSIVSRSVFVGLREAVSQMKRLIDRSAGGPGRQH